MKKIFFISWFVIYVINSFTGYLVNHVILGDTYKVIASSLHANVMGRLWAFILISITGSFFFTFIYTKWKKRSTVTEGLQYGLFVGIWITFSEYFSAYASSDAIPLQLVAEWILFGLLQYMISGVVVAFVFNYTKEKKYINLFINNNSNQNQ